MNSRLRLLLGFSLLVLAACQREEGKPERTSLTIQMPTTQQVLSKVGALSIPAGRKMCFAVNITGTGIPDGTGNCQPTLGATAGFVEAGQSVELEVKSGESRKIELYLHLKAAGDNSACPGIGSSISTASILTTTYLVGTVNNISLVEEEVSVSIPVTFPGESSHIAQTLGLPASCTTGVTVVTGGPLMMGAASGTVVHGSVGSLKAKVGAFISGSEASNANYKLRIKSE